MDDEDDDLLEGTGDDGLEPEAMGCWDYLLLAVGLACGGLFMLIAGKVALAIGVAFVCVGICAYAFVHAQVSHGPARWGAYVVCVLALVAFFVWSFKFVFHAPKMKATNGCGGVFWENMTNDLSSPGPRDEL